MFLKFCFNSMVFILCFNPQINKVSFSYCAKFNSELTLKTVVIVPDKVD